jgi:hypothetical protein
MLNCILCICLKEKKKAWDWQSEAGNKRSTVLTGNREPDAVGHFLKEGKKEMEAMCILYISMSMFSLDIYAAKPWYIVVSSYLD